MLVVETIARIRREHLDRGKSIRRIARELKLSRNTVRKAIRGDVAAFSYERSVQPLPKLGRWVGKLEDLLETHPLLSDSLVRGAAYKRSVVVIPSKRCPENEAAVAGLCTTSSLKKLENSAHFLFEDLERCHVRIVFFYPGHKVSHKIPQIRVDRRSGRQLVESVGQVPKLHATRKRLIRPTDEHDVIQPAARGTIEIPVAGQVVVQFELTADLLPVLRCLS